MNQLKGIIVAVQHNNHMSLVDVEIGADMFTATLLETPETAPYLKAGEWITLLFKETEVSLAKGLSGAISLRNRFPVTVSHIERGALLSAVRLDYRGESLLSIITTRGVDRLELAVDDEVEALVKANEMVLSHDD